MLLKVMQRFPIIVTASAALLGWLAGEMLLTDPALVSRLGEPSTLALYSAHVIGALLVVAIGKLMRRRAEAQSAAAAGP